MLRGAADLCSFSRPLLGLARGLLLLQRALRAGQLRLLRRLRRRRRSGLRERKR